MGTRLLHLALALCTWVAGCSSVPAHTLPDPLPETLEWARAGAAREGAFLGLDVRENDSGSLEELTFDPGVRVVEVVRNSPAEKAGVAIGDVLLAVDGEPINDVGALRALLASTPGGSSHTLAMRRGDSVFDVPVTLGERVAAAGEATLAWRSDPARSRAGWLTGHDGVVLVTSRKGGPFPDAGIPVGSIVTALDGEPVRSDRDLVRRLVAMRPGSRVEVTWRPGPDEALEMTTVTLLDAPRRVIRAGVPILVGYTAEPDGSEVSFSLLDLWFIWLFRYEREGDERHWSILRFLRFSTGVGALAE